MKVPTKMFILPLIMLLVFLAATPPALACSNRIKVSYETPMYCFPCGIGMVPIDDCEEFSGRDCRMMTETYRTCDAGTCGVPVLVGVFATLYCI